VLPEILTRREYLIRQLFATQKTLRYDNGQFLINPVKMLTKEMGALSRDASFNTDKKIVTGASVQTQLKNYFLTFNASSNLETYFKRFSVL
jgi:hypothetical protein